MTTKHILLICLGLEILAILMGAVCQDWMVWLQFSGTPVGLLIGLTFVLWRERKRK